MKAKRTQILEDVAGGRLTPEEAADLLGDEDGVVEGGAEKSFGAARTEGLIERRPLEVKAWLSSGGLIQVRGDEAATDVRLLGAVGGGDVTNRSGRIAVHAGGGAGKGAMVVPDDCDLDVEISAAAASIVGTVGELHAVLNVGDVEIDRLFDTGLHTVVANAGDIELNLRPGSDVRVRVRGASQSRPGADLVETEDLEWIMGRGAALLDVSGNFGCVYLSTER